MEILRSSDKGFPELDGYSFQPNFLEVPTENDVLVRIHYVDEGPEGVQPIVLLHGNPTWSYSYRKVIPLLVGAGYRVLAPDLVGLGRSDKPTELSDYSIGRHLSWLQSWFAGLDLEDIILVSQDWGGMLGLSIASQDSSSFAGIVVTNTGLYSENVTMEEEQMTRIEAWAEFARTTPDFPFEPNLEAIIQNELTAAEIAGYMSPYPSKEYKSGLRSFPSFIPVLPSGDDCRMESLRTWKRLENWHKPMLLAFSDKDPLTAQFENEFRARVPGTRGGSHTTIKGGGHLVQEDCPEELSEIVISFASMCKNRHS